MQRLWAILLAISVLMACGVEPPPAVRCAPGELTSCFCAADPSMSAACLPDGSGFAECRCPSCSCGGRTCGADNCGYNVCGTCQQGFTCSSAGACELDESRRWRITITDARLSPLDPNGVAWDLGSGPDLFVCGTVVGDRRCTEVINDSFNPTWLTGLMAESTASWLIHTGPTFEVIENDPIANERICAGPVQITREAFAAGRGSFACGTAVTVNYILLGGVF